MGTWHELSFFGDLQELLLSDLILGFGSGYNILVYINDILLELLFLIVGLLFFSVNSVNIQFLILNHRWPNISTLLDFFDFFYFFTLLFSLTPWAQSFLLPLLIFHLV